MNLTESVIKYLNESKESRDLMRKMHLVYVGYGVYKDQQGNKYEYDPRIKQMKKLSSDTKLKYSDKVIDKNKGREAKNKGVVPTSPMHGQMFGSSDGGAPEDFTNEQLSDALDKINEGRKNGNLDEVKKELPKGIISELSYSRWKYVAPEYRNKGKSENK